MSFRSSKVLITGGLGFIGSNLAKRLSEEGAEVRIIDSLDAAGGANRANLDGFSDRVDLVIGDQKNTELLKPLLKDVDFIFNCAGRTSHPLSMKEPLADLHSNLEIHIALLDACKTLAVKAPILYTSTRQIYGKPQYLPVDENHPINPPDANGIHKFAAEHFHRIYSEVYGLKTLSLRLTNIYGPAQPIKSASLGFVGWFVNRALLNEKIQLFGGGEILRDFLYVDDAVGAILASAQIKSWRGQALNVSGEKASLREVAEAIVSAAGQGQIETIPYPEERKSIEIGDYYGSSAAFQKETDWKAQISLKGGLSRMIAFYRDRLQKYL